MGELGKPLGPHCSKRGGSSIQVPPPRRLKNTVLGPSWSALGAILEPSWAFLGPYGGSLGPSWGHLEALEAHRKRKGEKAKYIDFLKYLTGFCLLEGAVEGSKGTGFRLGAALGPLGGMSETILTHLEVSWAIFEAMLRL